MRSLVTAVFLGLIGLTFWLDSGSGAPADGSGPAFRLRECAAERGLLFTHHPARLDPRIAHIEPHVAGVGASVSVVDVNADGWPDVYTTTSAFGRPNALFVNRGDGSFREVAVEAGLADVNVEGSGVSMGSVWGDVDNDGDADLYLYKWGRSRLYRNELYSDESPAPADDAAAPWPSRPDVVPRFTDVTDGSGLGRWMNCNAAVWLDYDRDGLLDLYAAGYFSEQFDLWNLSTTRIMHESFEFAANGGHNAMYRNLGDGRFADVTEALGVDSTRWTFALASADFDDDGWPDLYLANDYGPEECFLNRGGERFELQRGIGLGDDSKSGMAVSLGDVRNDGRLAVFVTNISKSGYLFQGNNLRVNLLAERGRFLNVAEGAVADCGWAWGAQFGDLDNDGWQDLFVANGFVSADPEADYWYEMSKVAGGTGDIFLDAANWSPMGDKSLSGFERSRLLLNHRGRGFSDAAAAAGVDDRLDGRGVALADLENRGVLDVLVANQRGPLLLYRNEPAHERHWIGFELRGTASNRDAIGARVAVVFVDPDASAAAGERAGDAALLHQVQFVTAGEGFAAQNDRRLHFGLGAADAVREVRVRWPSGLEQVLTGPAVDRYHRLVEPRLVEPRAGAARDGDVR